LERFLLLFARWFLFPNGSYSYPCVSLFSDSSNLIYTISVEEELEAGPIEASNKDVNLFQVRQRARLTFQSG
jgi:hypothetical protein